VNGPIGVAIVGCGHVGTAHAKTIRGARHDPARPTGLRGVVHAARRRLRRLRGPGRQESAGIAGVELVAVVDTDEERARRLGRTFEVPLVSTDFGEVLGRTDIDAVLICTPPHLHMGMVLEAAAAGKHIFCEKPMALASAQCDRMIEAAARAGVVLQIGYVFRFSSDRGTLRDAVISGELGRPVLWREVNNLRAGPPQRWVHDYDVGRGLLWEDSHPLDLMIATLGNPVSVHAFTGKFKPGATTAPDMVVASIRFQDGDKALFTNSYSLPGFGWGNVGLRRNWMQIDIVGPSGYLQLPDEALQSVATVFRVDGGQTAQVRRCAWSDEWGGNGYREELEHFFGCVTRGTESCVNGVEGRRVIWLLEGILRSAETGKVCCFEGGRPVE
jgi:predicted dehydrogenase